MKDTDSNEHDESEDDDSLLRDFLGEFHIDGEHPWEYRAKKAIERIGTKVTIDELRGVALFDGQEFRTLGGLEDGLLQTYRHDLAQLLLYYHGGVAWDADLLEEDFVVQALRRLGLPDFFARFAAPEGARELISSADIVLVEGSGVVRIDVESVNEELIKYLAKHPDKMHKLHWRSFEQLVAELFHNLGYEVILGKGSKDGGVDIRAISKSAIGTALLTLVQCKKQGPTVPVGVEVVTRMFGTVTMENATHGVIVTTSYFTKGAKALQERLKYRIGLTDYGRLTELLNGYKLPRPTA